MHPPEAILEVLVGLVSNGSRLAGERLAGFAEGRQVAGGRDAAGACVRRSLERCVCLCRDGHWRPGEVLRVSHQRLGARASVLARAAMRSEWRQHGSPAIFDWGFELERLEHSRVRGAAPAGANAGDGSGDELTHLLDPGAPGWAGSLRRAVELIALLRHLPALPAEPPPGGVSGGVSGNASGDASRRRILERVRALLAKAEATTFPEEADALSAKAQELLARHNLDRAALGSAAGQAGGASMRRIWIDEPYLPAKHLLLHVVAGANRCRAVLLGDLGLVAVAGHSDDLDTVELLFTSLLVQATRQLSALGSGDPGGHSRSAGFRRSFLVAFATRIGQRLRSTARASEAAGVSEHGSSLLPVLAARRSAADEAIDELFGELEHTRVRAGDAAGWVAGTAAADLANLSVNAALGGNGHTATG